MDWEGDGDLDILSGDIDGSVHLLRNESGGKALTFGPKEKVKAAGAPIAAPGRNSGPVVADWDGDGRHDLVLGCGDGSVRFYRNTAEEGEPTFGEPVLLVASTSPVGSRVKLAVFDWNGDGALDLLLGDFSSKPPPPLDLTEEQEKRKAELEAKQKVLQPKMSEHYRRIQAEILKQMGLAESDRRSFTPEQTKEYGERFQKRVQEDEELQAIQKDWQELWQELSKYRGRNELAGHVWLFLRRA